MMVSSQNHQNSIFQESKSDPLFAGLKDTRKLDDLSDDEKEEYIEMLKFLI